MLITAAHLDLFGWIGKQEKSPRALAAHFGGEAAAWEIFLNALCGMGLMRKRAEKFANSAFSSRHLSGAGAALLLPNYDAWNSWGGLASSLITGNRPRSQKPFVADRAQAKRLLCALHIHAQQIAPYLIEKLPLAGCQTLLDVGGGLGTFAAAFCRHYPRLRATLVEHPNVLPLARRALRDWGMAKKVRVIGADFSRNALPRGFDSVFVSNVLHAHGVAENRSLLGKLHRCLNPRRSFDPARCFHEPGQDRSRVEHAVFRFASFAHAPRALLCPGRDSRMAAPSRVLTVIRGPYRSSPLPFDPDSILIAQKR